MLVHVPSPHMKLSGNSDQVGKVQEQFINPNFDHFFKYPTPQVGYCCRERSCCRHVFRRRSITYHRKSNCPSSLPKVAYCQQKRVTKQGRIPKRWQVKSLILADGSHPQLCYTTVCCDFAMIPRAARVHPSIMARYPGD
jgi:hypothetical protein